MWSCLRLFISFLLYSSLISHYHWYHAGTSSLSSTYPSPFSSSVTRISFSSQLVVLFVISISPIVLMPLHKAFAMHSPTRNCKRYEIQEGETHSHHHSHPSSVPHHSLSLYHWWSDVHSGDHSGDHKGDLHWEMHWNNKVDEIHIRMNGTMCKTRMLNEWNLMLSFIPARELELSRGFATFVPFVNSIFVRIDRSMIVPSSHFIMHFSLSQGMDRGSHVDPVVSPFWRNSTSLRETLQNWPSAVFSHDAKTEKERKRK